MIRASLGTAKALQLEHCHVDVLPTTAYLLTPGRCSNYCAFCTQSANSNSKEEFLSRVSWPKYPFSLIVDSLGKAYQDGLLKQVCIQMVKNGQPKESTNFIVKAIQNSSYIPITLSCVVDSLAEADYYFSLGIKHLGISLDAVTPQIYQKIKTGQWQKTVSLIEEIARKYPNRLTTHIIIGLGETEEEAVQLITYLTKINVNVGLFAFTPIKGTALQYLPPPSLGSYRRIQIAYYLIKQGINDFLYDRKGKLISFGLERSLLADFLDQGIPFQTSGCPDCNRPYYNESPGKKLYNYPRPLTVIEFANALEECNAKKCGSAMTKKCGSAMTKKCRFLDHGFLDPYTNMAVDEVLLAGQSPVLRFYQWTVPTISAGYFQKNEQLLYKKSQALNFGFVRRITGGRAVLHADELTYSVVLPNDKGKSVLFFYREISQVLLDAFREIGLETADFQAGKSKEQKSAFCFLSPSFYEIIVQGKKLVGSSQIQRHGFLLQHGSIPFTLDYGVLADIFSCQDDLKNSIISLEEALGHKINKKELKKALLRSFEKNLEVESSQEELSLDEKAEVSRLVKEKYSQLTWNIRDKG